ncbi:MAG: hypothetical protein JNM72_22935 [Deltaproteobacteria bacterium]|nr:hypothetical protein [Deltaproteobacteria bacterium]
MSAAQATRLLALLAVSVGAGCGAGDDKLYPPSGGGDGGEETGSPADGGGGDGGDEGTDTGPDDPETVFEDPGDAVIFRDEEGNALVGLADEGGESNKGQQFLLVLVNTLEDDLGFQAAYTVDSGAGGAGGPPPPRASAAPAALAGSYRSRLAAARGAGRLSTATPPPAVSYTEADIGVAATEFRVRDAVDDDETFQLVAARLWAVGSAVNIFVDTEWPIDWDIECDGVIDVVDPRGAQGFNNCDLRDIARVVDENIAPTLTTKFGALPDINGDGKVSIVITPVLNAMTRNPEDEADEGTFVRSYTDPEVDLVDYDVRENPQSDEQEVIFVFAPDPAGFANPFVQTTVEAYTSMDLLGEIARGYVRLISYNAKVITSGGDAEAPWLLEGLGALAADLTGFGAVYYDDVWDFLDASHLYSLVVVDEVGPINTENWGAQYLFVRWLYENYGVLSGVTSAETGEPAPGEDLLVQLVQGAAIGQDSVEGVMGVQLVDLVVKWNVALTMTGRVDEAGEPLVDVTSYPLFAPATRLEAPPDAPGEHVGANGYQTGINIRGINRFGAGGLTDTPSEVEDLSVMTAGVDAALMVTGIDFYGSVAKNYGSQVVRLVDIPYDGAALRLDSPNSGYAGVVIRTEDPRPGEYVVENIYSSLAANSMPLPTLPSDGSRIYGLGEIQPEGATLKVLDDGETLVGSVYDTDRWLLDLSDRPSDEVVRVAIHLERRYVDTAGAEGPADPWLAVLDRSLVPTPTVEGTKRGTCPEGGAPFAYPASVLDYLYFQVYLSHVSSGAVGTEEPEPSDDTAAPEETDFNPCGEPAGVPTDCSVDWDLDGVLDIDEPRPSSFLEQVQVMQCTLSGGSIAPSSLATPRIFDLDEQDEDEDSSYDRARLLGGRYAADGEEAFIEASVSGGQQYIIVVGAGTDLGPYELRVQQTN